MIYKYWEIRFYCSKCKNWVYLTSNSVYGLIIKEKDILIKFFGKDNIKIIKKMRVINKV